MASNPTVVAPKSPSPGEDSAGQAQKLSVSWIFDAPSVQRNDPSAPSSPCVGQSVANTRLSGLHNRPEAKIGSQPRVFILYPRAHKPVAFVRCCPGAERAGQRAKIPRGPLSLSTPISSCWPTLGSDSFPVRPLAPQEGGSLGALSAPHSGHDPPPPTLTFPVSTACSLTSSELPGLALVSGTRFFFSGVFQ